MLSRSSSPESIPSASISSEVITETGKAPVILAPLIWEPTTTTSSTSEAFASSLSCAETANGINKINDKEYYKVDYYKKSTKQN